MRDIDELKLRDVMKLMVKNLRFVIPEEDLASAPGTRLDHSELLCGRLFIPVNKRKLLTQISEMGRRVPHLLVFSSVPSLSRVRLFVTPWTAARQASHQLLELAQTHVHRVGDAIQPSHPLSSFSPLVFYLAQHQDLFQWGHSLHQAVTVLEFQLQNRSFQWIFRTDFL